MPSRETAGKNPAMQKLSQLILALAESVLAQPTEKSSREANAAALLLAHAGWNRAVDPFADPFDYRKILSTLEAKNPKCVQELKSTDWESLIKDVVTLKKARHPKDNRFIQICGLTAENKVHVEWHHLSKAARN